ncbi:MAG: electron transfer flavoprotein subunit alpha/FixB family protein [Verrucomicrobia bacterium]|nr:electron transfer flavoprotein subunit alpha/FixB family protein [Verrucomicrobiota bacterium]MCF7708058.1 electron transfer flavoprotein subunit alpha/FixB family protein [Verrucomicrobiota bacterium]
MNGGILVLAEQLKGEPTGVAFEMLGVGRTIADELGVQLEAVVIGGEGDEIASGLGAADKVLKVDMGDDQMPVSDTVVSILDQVSDKRSPALILIGCTNVSQGIGTRLAERRGLAHLNFCTKVNIEDGRPVFTSQLFGGKIFADATLPEDKGVVSIYPGAFPAEAGKSEKTPEVEKIDVEVPESPVVFKRFIEPEIGDVDITGYDVLVSVGRGIQNPDNIELAEELAAAMGGAVSASRPVIDQGWLPLTRQVGKSGMNVKPKLYLALGISGAPEHQEGMKNASMIVAVNTDDKAPIFDISHYGTTIDLFDLVEVLKDKLEEAKGT